MKILCSKSFNNNDKLTAFVFEKEISQENIVTITSTIDLNFITYFYLFYYAEKNIFSGLDD